jgi:hypothetical protein
VDVCGGPVTVTEAWTPPAAQFPLPSPGTRASCGKYLLFCYWALLKCTRTICILAKPNVNKIANGYSCGEPKPPRTATGKANRASLGDLHWRGEGAAGEDSVAAAAGEGLGFAGRKKRILVLYW